MLQSGNQQIRLGPLPLGGVRIAGFPRRPVFLQQTGKRQFRGIRRQPGKFDLDDISLREAAANFPDILLQAADHHLVEPLLEDFHATGEAVRIEDFQ